MASMLAITSSFSIAPLHEAEKPKKKRKPDFTDEELNYLRTLPKRERNRALAELRSKKRNGGNHAR